MLVTQRERGGGTHNYVYRFDWVNYFCSVPLLFLLLVIQTEISVESFDVPTTFRLSFKLSHFRFVVHDEVSNLSSPSLQENNCASSSSSLLTSSLSWTTSSSLRVLEVDFGVVQANLYLRSCLDCSDKEVYAWKCGFSMSDFTVR